MSDSCMCAECAAPKTNEQIDAELDVRCQSLSPSAPAAVARVEKLEEQLKLLPQVEIHTQHVIHAGLYARTITIPAGVALTSARIKRATLLIVSGDVIVSGSGQPFRVTGHHVLPASAGRKTAWYAVEDTELTMLFPTSARTVEDAEREFTDEVDTLLSHRNSNDVLITQE